MLEEAECKIAETLEVPKALGDVFEALIGAVFLDSGKSLPIVWKVIYRLMKKEICKSEQSSFLSAINALMHFDEIFFFCRCFQPEGPKTNCA